MNCNGTPINDKIAHSIEAWNLYCKYNQAWIEMYVAWASFWLPKK